MYFPIPSYWINILFIVNIYFYFLQQQRLDELHQLWELLLSRLADKGLKLQQALVLVQFLRQCDEVMFWINDKVSTSLNYLYKEAVIFND